MNIIQNLQSDKNYLAKAIKVLQLNFETISIDCSKGETDNTLLIFIRKDNLSFNEAFNILTIKKKMLLEEWDDIDIYDKVDIKLWAQMLLKEYANSTYYENVTSDEFLNDHFIHRLQFEDGINSILNNNIQITFEQFKEINPCEKNFIKISKSSYKNLDAEYYIETDEYFVLFNWYTTA